MRIFGRWQRHLLSNFYFYNLSVVSIFREYANYLESVKVARCGLVVDGERYGLNVKVELGGALNVSGIGSGSVMATDQDAQRGIGARHVRKVMEHTLERWPSIKSQKTCKIKLN